MSRILAFIDTAELRPIEGLYAPEFAGEIAKEFQFQKYPQTVEEFNVQKGIEFLTGRVGRKAIGKLVIWPNIIVVEGRSTTDECKAVLDELLQWGAEKFNLNYSPEMITRYAYVSDLSFTSTAPILNAFSLLQRIAESTSEALTEIWQEPIKYELSELKIGHDPLVRQWGIAPFQIARLAQHSFSEGRYFSEAPLPTDLHIRALEEYEVGILAIQDKATAM